MTREERLYIIKLISQETGCRLVEASTSIKELIEALKHKPSTILDKPTHLKITWE